MSSAFEREVGRSIAQYRTLDLHAQCPMNFMLNAVGSIPRFTRKRGENGKEEEKGRKNMRLFLNPFCVSNMHCPN